MSVVTNVMLSHSILEPPEVREAITAPALRPGASFDQKLANISDDEAGDNWGGSKWPEVDVWAAAFNHIDVAAFREQIAAIPWKEPELVQLFIQNQWADKFDVWEFRSGQLICVLGEGTDIEW